MVAQRKTEFFSDLYYMRNNIVPGKQTDDQASCEEALRHRRCQSKHFNPTRRT